jgi:hypothetical protein
MATEKTLEIYKNGEYNNIVLKTRVDKKTNMPFIGLNYDEFIVVEKNYVEGRPFGQYGSFSCSVKYQDKDVTFVLNGDQHNTYKALGGVGDKVKITAYRHKYQHDGEEKESMRFRFELV